ncbi:hypothetical protein T08_10326 [Trichinella sp. T8]|nr:hypothetical protein T08_10326 [Trichinella sp. T8]
MLLATAFLPVPHVNTGVSLLEAGTTDSADERLPLWNNPVSTFPLSTFSRFVRWFSEVPTPFI